MDKNIEIKLTDREKELMKWLNDEVFRFNTQYFLSDLRKREKELLGT